MGAVADKLNVAPHFLFDERVLATKKKYYENDVM